MSHPLNKSKSLFFLLLGTVVFLSPVSKIKLIPPGVAHEVKVSGDVAATFHLEPNHNPRAGQKSQIWFALTRRGGQVIPVSECNCQLAIYREPRKANDKPLLQPQIKGISAEKYQNVPGTEVIFPQAGSYQLELKGTPKGNANFKPFQFSYNVIVR